MGIELKLQLWRHIDDATQRATTRRKFCCALDRRREIILACKRNAVVRNIAFGSDGSADG
jgi:hypothetical protein